MGKKLDAICVIAVLFAIILTVLFMHGEALGLAAAAPAEPPTVCKAVFSGTEAELTGSGAYFSDGTLHIVSGGSFELSGSLEGSVAVEAEGSDLVNIILSSLSISAPDGPALLTEQAKSLTLTLEGENTLTAQNEGDLDGVVYSRDDLIIKGEGTLQISGPLHGIVCNDTLTVESGSIFVKAGEDGLHANDGINMKGGALRISAGDDGMNAKNDTDTSVITIEAGSIDIVSCYEGIEANTVQISGGEVSILPVDDGINGCGSGSLIEISGGSVRIVNENGRDADGLDSNGDILISGGSLFVSMNGSGTNLALDYGSENGGKCRISGGTVLAAGSSQMLEPVDESSEQGFITMAVSGSKGSRVTLSRGGAELYNEEIPCAFTALTVSVPGLIVNDECTLTVDGTEYPVTVDNSSPGGMGGMGNGIPAPGGMRPGEGEPPELPQGGMEPPTGERPELPQGGMEPPTGERPELPQGGMEPPTGEQPQMPQDAPGQQMTPEADRPDLQTPLLVGTAVIVLLLGILFAAKFKTRR